jgi:hypothetical protein
MRLNLWTGIIFAKIRLVYGKQISPMKNKTGLMTLQDVFMLTNSKALLIKF